eukprot:2882845-Pleurochrysis_carterae.AAC.2
MHCPYLLQLTFTRTYMFSAPRLILPCFLSHFSVPLAWLCIRLLSSCFPLSSQLKRLDVPFPLPSSFVRPLVLLSFCFESALPSCLSASPPPLPLCEPVCSTELYVHASGAPAPLQLKY